ncbi:MAG TPA: nickel-dependent lactate racemase [bacterium]|nr:nickel-dependent lactate racemase [Candidatus Omnitrophota bacterium]HOJ59144.1 nickel-dependent lactate racemase [bacterium]HOL95958.1 nickel-dependent lactate racemase [bacterium]HPP00060.1 nickel-dependent lactate racemase [bacterium]HXK92187.1 nickel-dependent lactate racemase [bacterium]
MDLRLAYGKKGLDIQVPDRNLAGVMHMRAADPLADPGKAIEESLRRPIQSRPLPEIARGRSSAVVVISDITRPVPNPLLLPPILRTIEEAGVPHEKITILIATGIHRPNLGDELTELVGASIAENYTVVNHYSEDPETNAYVGEIGGGIPVYLDKTFLEADLKILTGLVELHLMAGFSGGRKAVLPGIVTLETMKHMHGYRMLQQDSTYNGRLKGNPFHEAGVAIARQVGVDFIANVTLNEKREITGVFSGDLEAAHEKACELVAQCAMIPIEEEVDIVITTGGGYPLDKTLYQSIKGFVAALEAVKPGGTVILAARNEEGGGSHEFVSLLRQLEDPMHFYRLVQEPNYIAKDQWMIQELVNGLHHCELLYFSEGISPNDMHEFLLTPITSVEEGIEQALRRHGPDAKILVMPEGPYVMPKLRHLKKKMYSWQTDAAAV